jgi:acylphosphatase
MKAVHVIAKGRVQGVYFRDYTRRQALQLNLTGWVRNLPDGSVEATLCGKEIDVSSMLDWFKQGSPLSRVDNLLVEKVEADEAFTAFEIRY